MPMLRHSRLRSLSFPLSLTFVFFNVILIFVPFLPRTSGLQFRNITLLNTDSSISYQGAWTAVRDSGATNGAYKITRTEEAQATITRQFRSVYYNAPLWPLPVQLSIVIESENVNSIIDLQDDSMAQIPSLSGVGLSPSSKPSQIRFSFTSTTNAIRTLKVSASSTGASGWVALVDSIIFEVDDPIIPPPPPPPTPPTTTRVGTAAAVRPQLTTSINPLVSNNPLRTVGSDTSSIFTGTPTLFTTSDAAPSPLYPEPAPPNIPNDPNPISSPPTTTFLVGSTTPTTTTGPPTSVASTAVPTLSPSDQGRNKNSEAVLIALIVCAVLVFMLIIAGVLRWYAIKKRREGRGDHNGGRSLELPVTLDNGRVADEQERFEEKAVKRLITPVSFPEDAHTWSSEVKDVFDVFTVSSGSYEPNFGVVAAARPSYSTPDFTRHPSPLNVPHNMEHITSLSDVDGQTTSHGSNSVRRSVGSNSSPTSVSNEISTPIAPPLARRYSDAMSMSTFHAASREGIEDSSSQPSARVEVPTQPLVWASSRSSCYPTGGQVVPCSAPELSQYSTPATTWSRPSMAWSIHHDELLELLEGTSAAGLTRKFSALSTIARGLHRVGSIPDVHHYSTVAGRNIPLQTRQITDTPPQPSISLSQPATERLQTLSTPAKLDDAVEGSAHTPTSDRSSTAVWNEVMDGFPEPPKVEISASRASGIQVMSSSAEESSRATTVLGQLGVTSVPLPRPLPSINRDSSRSPILHPTPCALASSIPNFPLADAHDYGDPPLYSGLSTHPFLSTTANNALTNHSHQSSLTGGSSTIRSHQYHNSQYSTASSLNLATPPPQYTSGVSNMEIAQEAFMRSHEDFLRSRDAYLAATQGNTAISSYTLNEPASNEIEDGDEVLDTEAEVSRAMSEIQRMVIAEIERLETMTDDIETCFPP